MSGTVNISRDLWADEAFASESFSEREAWIWLICEASWKPRKKRVGDFIVDLGRGQLAHSTRFMAEKWRWTHSKARRFLERLEKLDLIRRETGTGVSVVTICKYDKYQSTPQTGGTRPAQERHTSGTNENKDEIREKEKSGARKRGTRLKDTWVLPRDWGQWAVAEGWAEVTVRAEAEKFKDYWLGESGQRAAKLDWFAVWRNWMRKSKSPKIIDGGHRDQSASTADRLQRTIAAAAAGSSGKDWG